jgi:hypothetical protein
MTAALARGAALPPAPCLQVGEDGRGEPAGCPDDDEHPGVADDKHRGDPATIAANLK